jgi:hypothetical protein
MVFIMLELNVEHNMTFTTTGSKHRPVRDYNKVARRYGKDLKRILCFRCSSLYHEDINYTV